MSNLSQAILVALLAFAFTSPAWAENQLLAAYDTATPANQAIIAQRIALSEFNILNSQDGVTRNICTYESFEIREGREASRAEHTLIYGQSCWLKDQSSAMGQTWLKNRGTLAIQCIDENIALLGVDEAYAQCFELAMTAPSFITHR